MQVLCDLQVFFLIYNCQTPANLEFVGENSLTYEIHSVNIIVEKVLPIDGQPK